MRVAHGTSFFFCVVLLAQTDAPQRLASRAEQSPVLLHDTRELCDEQMKLFGQWDDFESGKRGFSK